MAFSSKAFRLDSNMPPSFGSFEIVDFYAELSRIEWLCFRPRQVSRRASKRKMKLLSSDPDGSILTAKRPSSGLLRPVIAMTGTSPPPAKINLDPDEPERAYLVSTPGKQF